MNGMAFDPAVPQRDALLRHAAEVLHVKYRWSESLRVTWREGEDIFAARSGEHRGAAAQLLGASLWRFPHDRRLTALPRLADPGALGCARTRIVAYAAERSATAACLSPDGDVVAYAKVQAPGAAAAERRITRAIGAAIEPSVRVPRVLAGDGGLVVLEAPAGRRLDGLGADALARLGAALATLHALPAPATRFARLDPARLATAAGVLRRARPDVAPAATRLLARLDAARDDGRRPPVCLHGDANLRNALLLDDDRIGLIDLEHVSAGPAAADLGQLLAGLFAALPAGRPRGAGRLRPRRPAARPRGAALAHRGVAAGARRAAGGQPRAPGHARAAPGAAGGGRRAGRARHAAPHRGGRMRPALLFYCQHSVGLGHLMRSYALCAELARRFRVVLLCGGELPEGIAPPAGVEIVALPPLGVQSGRFGSRDARLSTERAWALRSDRIQATLRTVQPAVVLVELFPFGRAKFARELVPLLREARALGALTACSLRDILVSGRDDQRAHDDRARDLADAHLDAVLVHCDPSFARLEDTFAPTRPLHVPVHYTGFATNLKQGVRPL